MAPVPPLAALPSPAEVMATPGAARSGLRVVSGPYRKTVPYTVITGVKPSRSLLSAPALSLDRLEVTTTKMLPVIISPLEKEKFIKKLEEKIGKTDNV